MLTPPRRLQGRRHGSAAPAGTVKRKAATLDLASGVASPAGPPPDAWRAHEFSSCAKWLGRRSRRPHAGNEYRNGKGSLGRRRRIRRPCDAPKSRERYGKEAAPSGVVSERAPSAIRGRSGFRERCVAEKDRVRDNSAPMRVLLSLSAEERGRSVPDSLHRPRRKTAGRFRLRVPHPPLEWEGGRRITPSRAHIPPARRRAARACRRRVRVRGSSSAPAR